MLLYFPVVNSRFIKLQFMPNLQNCAARRANVQKSLEHRQTKIIKIHIYFKTLNVFTFFPFVYAMSIYDVNISFTQSWLLLSKNFTNYSYNKTLF
jgi:hypothetical protein